MKAAVLRSLNCSLNPYSFFLDPACICSSSGPCFQSLRPFWPSRTKETSRSGIILISLGLKLDQVSYPMGTRDKFFVRRFLPSRISPCSFLLLLHLRTPQLNNLKAATAAKIFLGSTGKLFYFIFLSLSPPNEEKWQHSPNFSFHFYILPLHRNFHLSIELKMSMEEALCSAFE